MSSSSTPTFTKLNSVNYSAWAGEMSAWLKTAGVWRIVQGKSTAPSTSSPPTAEQSKLLEDWEIKSDKAAGWLFMMVEPDQRVHFNGISDDPVAMWKALETVHLQKKPGTRFNAYDDLFSIRMEENESLQTLLNRVDTAVNKIRELRPSDFTLDKLDEELASMACIRALGDDYSAFISSLLLKDNLDKATIHQAFVTEETQRKRRAVDSSHLAMSALSSFKEKKSPAGPLCRYCKRPGHIQANCYLYVGKQVIEKQKATSKSSSTSANSTTTTVQEYAGNASVSDLSSPLQLKADFDWIADTGATSHMTPHRHWLRDYTPLCIPIKLADHSVIYSAGIGTVIFNPVINGQSVQPVQFSRVLHVPQLRNNLLACLYLTRHKQFHIHIDAEHLHFKLHNKVLFCASINSNNSALLDGVTEAVSQYAQLAATVPMDLNLWHRRLAHHNYADVKRLLKNDMVTGMIINSKEQPDPICESCLAGKMHSNPFPISHTQYTTPLQLVHSDLHGPLPTVSYHGYKYWIVFIDAYTAHKSAIPLKAKSEAFEAFKIYKAWAENHFGTKILALQDDKGGEYMSTAFLRFTKQCGIDRRHSTRNRPQQNGVAERANRTMGEDITAMLAESHLPPSFWEFALAAQIHIWNRLPTVSLKGITPFEAAMKQKPDLGHLRVFGCTAYVYVQKDQRKSLQSHMQKCVFIGYPSGYKGWLFYNPTTKKLLISERAEFDERHFSGLSKSATNHSPITMPSPVSPTIIPLPVFEEDEPTNSCPSNHTSILPQIFSVPPKTSTTPIQPVASLPQTEPNSAPVTPLAPPPVLRCSNRVSKLLESGGKSDQEHHLL